MANTKMSIAQWKDYDKAVKSGDKAKAARIMDLGYQPEYDPTLVAAEEAQIIETEEEEDENEAILNDVAGGLENKEIYRKYGISPAKLTSIKKGAK